jgi:iron complex transport system ATP-binding protein
VLALRLTGVDLRLDGVDVLRDVTWEVAPEQRWVVVGPNGAGKTTLLRIGSLYLHPTRGEVEVLGCRLGRCDVRSLRERIALSSPALAARLAPGITALEAVLTGLHAALAPWWHEYDETEHHRARRLLDRFGCGDLADHRFSTLSAGERQRVLLARTIVNEPDLVLLDEPTAGLDIGGREQLVADLARMAREPDAPPTVLVTHHLEEIPPGFTHALVLGAGRVVAAGEIERTLTGAVLSEAFGIALRVERVADRFTASLA